MKTQYDKFAAVYTSKQPEFYSKNVDVSRKALYSHLPASLKGKRVLDIGCGDGIDLKYLIRKGADAYGLDISEQMVKLAKKNVPSAKLSVQDFNSTNFNGSFFDLIVSRFALNYSNNLKATFQEVYRILKKKGDCVYLAPHPFSDFFFKAEKNYYKKENVQGGNLRRRFGG